MVKVKVNLEQATKAQRGSRGLALLFLQIRHQRGEGCHCHSPVALPPGKTRYQLYRRLGGSQDRSGRVRKISPPTEIRSPDSPSRSESLYRLRYGGPLSSCRPIYSVAVIWSICGIIQTGDKGRTQTRWGGGLFRANLFATNPT